MMVLRKLYLVPFLFYRIWLAGKKYIGDYMPGFLIGKKISTHAIQAGNITPEIHGLENIPKEDGFIFYPNHQGLFDVLMFFYSSPKPFAFVIKKEAKNVILLKQAIQATGSLPMDREDLRQSMQVISAVTQDVKNGKGGSFKAAQKAKCPIVPCALINSFVPFDENSVRQVTVKLLYLKPLYYEEYRHMRSNEIAEEVKRRIEEAIEKNL